MDALLKLDLSHVLNTVEVEKNDVLNCIKKLDDKLNSSSYGFLKRFQPSVAVPCSCDIARDSGSSCPCPPNQLKMAFSLHNRQAKPDPPKPCLPDCKSLCKCGKDCPSREGDFERLQKRMFHVPGCPGDESKFSLPVPRSPVEGMKACPYSPACCPIGDVCPFPINTIFDINAPPLPKQGSRTCPLLPTRQAGSKTDCNLCPMTKRAQQNCPLTGDCTQSQQCPLLSCSLGPLKTFIFDGEDECPFCHKKCCPMILPGGPGCPLEQIGNICNLKNKDECCLGKTLQSKNTRQIVDNPNEESCPLGEMIAKKLQSKGCPCSGARNESSLTKHTANTCKCGTQPTNNSRQSDKNCPLTNSQIAQNCKCPGTNSSFPSVPQQSKMVPCGARDLLDCPALRKAPAPFIPSWKSQTKQMENSNNRMPDGLGKSSGYQGQSKIDQSNVQGKPQGMKMYDSDENVKPKPKNCPIPDPVPCPLATPKCPFSPPQPACPLLREVNCPLQPNEENGLLGRDRKQDCPVETEPCEMFPGGHCPMEDMGLCECAYPISPCMSPPILKEEGEAKDQYCSRLDCCMGLPLPPIKPSDEFETDKWYAFRTLEPTDLITKHFLEILDVPPSPEFFVSVNESRKHPAWRILKCGEGYKQCKRVREIIAARGSTGTVETQFDRNDLPDDEEIEIIEQNRKEAEAKIKDLEKDACMIDWVS